MPGVVIAKIGRVFFFHIELRNDFLQKILLNIIKVLERHVLLRQVQEQHIMNITRGDIS